MIVRVKRWLSLYLLSVGILVSHSASADPYTFLTEIDWLPTDTTCPADYLPRQSIKEIELKVDCKSDPEQCVAECRKGWAYGCYAVATNTQFKRKYYRIAQSLFLQSCKLGIDSGCTNATARLSDPESDNYQCQNETFDLMCEAGDHSACSMLAISNYKGEGVDRNLTRSIDLFERACKLAKDKATCSSSEVYIKQLKEIRDRELKSNRQSEPDQ